MKVTLLAIFLSALLALSNGAALSSSEESSTYPVNIGQALKMYYVALQSIMPCGYAPLNIPVLAPLTVSDVALNVTNENYGLSGSMSNIYVTGLNSYVLLKFDFDPSTGVLNYDTFVPQIQFLAESDLDFWAMVAGYKLDMSGSGLWDLKFESIRFVGSFVLAPNALGQMKITNHKLNFYIGDVHVNNWYDSWNISANNYYNQWLRNFILIASQQGQQAVNDLYNEWLMPYFNKLWSQVTEEELVSVLVDESALMSMSNCMA